MKETRKTPATGCQYGCHEFADNESRCTACALPPTEKVTKFASRAEAWKFMYGCDDAGIMAGFPEPAKGGGFTVAWIPN